MAFLYLAEDLKHNRKVAVKVLPLDRGSRIQAGRFVREIRVAPG